MLKVIRLLFILLIALLLNSCGDDTATSKPKNTLKILAGSELKDLKPMLDTIRKETGYHLDFEFIGTLDGAEKIVNGGANYDLAWFSHAKYLSLLQGQNKKILAQEKIGISPVIPAVKLSKAREWGWTDNEVSWADIAAKVASGELSYAMTDPTASNSGFSTVMGVQAAFSGSSDVITSENVDTAKLKQFFSGQKLTSGSSGWLADAYVRDQSRLNGLFNYESILLSLNDSGKLDEKLHLIYPKEGIVSADYPLILLNKEKKEVYNQLIEYLKTTGFQQWMMENTNRRPVITEVRPDSRFPQAYLLELPFPNNINTVNEILFSYLDKYRRPNHSIFVLDTSGSMKGQRLEDLKSAILNLTGADQSVSGQFARFREREKVSLITFSDHVKETQLIEIDSHEQKNAGMQSIIKYINSLTAKGGTAVYDALVHAYDIAIQASQNDNERYYTIVLMSDGLSNNGRDYKQFSHYFQNKSDHLAGIKTFPVLFGAADVKEMHKVAELTGGKVFDARKHSLSHVFKQIRGYQ